MINLDRCELIKLIVLTSKQYNQFFLRVASGYLRILHTYTNSV